MTFEIAGAPDILPHCDKYGDTYGEWIENPIAYDDGIKRFEYHNNSASSTLEELSKHFLGSVGPGAALDFPFNKVWKPKECAYHRFTNDTIHRCVKHTTNVEGTNSGKYLHIVFMGDSATRGVLCGLLRIVHGSEQFGSCESKICGDIPSHPHAVSYQEIQQINEQYLLRGKLRLTFIYEKSFIAYGWDMDNFLVTYIKENKVDYVILNTGVWDYDDIARRHIGQDAEDTCAELKNGWDYEKSIERANKHVNDTVHRLARVGKAHNITMIYRTNHHNNRYGPYCADHKVIPLYEHAGWEIWDNMRISKDVWKEQTWDGFHFERIYHCRPEKAKALAYNNTFYNIYGYWMKWPNAGALEQQLAQSLLNRLLYNCLVDHFGDSPK